MTSQITLDAKGNAKVKKAIPTSSNKIYYVARARIYQAHAGNKKWSYTGLQGALVFVLNTSSKTLHFQMVDLNGRKGVIWDYELHDGLVLDQDETVTFFLSFEGYVGGDKFMIGFVFREDSEAKTFYNHVKVNKDPKSDPSWTALFEDLDGHFGNHEMEFVKNFVQNYSELQLVGAPRRKITLLPHPSTRSQSGVPRIQLFRRTARTRPPPVPSDGPVRPVIELEDDKSPPPTHAPPAKPLPSIPPDHRDLPFSREMELKQIRKETRYSHLRYSEYPPSLLVLPHFTLRNMSISPSINPSSSASSKISAGTLIRRQELPAPTFEAVQAESLTPDTSQTTQLPSQSSQNNIAPWILVSRTPHEPKKPIDSQFMEYMAEIRRQTNQLDTSSTSATPPISLMIPHHSITSSAFSQSLSVTSSPPRVEFPPTPVFKDEILKVQSYDQAMTSGLVDI